MKTFKHYFEDKVCWITGAGTGIGRDLASTLADLGAHVFISGRRQEKLDELAKSNERIFPIKLDVSNAEQWKEATALVSQKFSHIDILILNAGICEYVDLPEFNAEAFQKTFEINFMGIVHGIENTLPLLEKSNSAQISAVTSSVAVLPLPRAEAYGASKAAATYLLNSLRLDLMSRKISTSVILPGFVETPLTEKNDFPMPFKISPKKATFQILKGLMKKKKEIYFPGKFTWPLRLISILPMGLQQFVTRRFSK